MADDKSHKGDCFEVAANYTVDNPDKNLLLVHGVVIGRGEQNSGMAFIHAWIETSDGLVIDNSNSKNIVCPIELYYELGNIGKAIKYNRDEAMINLLKYKNFGDWDDSLKASINNKRGEL